MLIEIETSRRTHHRAIAEREMSVRIGVAPARSDVRRVQNVSIHQLDVRANFVVPLSMALLNMFAPEVYTFEELRAFGDFAAVFVDIFLLNELNERSA